MSALGGFNRIDVTDDVGDRHVRRGKFLYKARITTNPIDVGGVAVNCQGLPPIRRDRIKGIVVTFRAGDNRYFIVQKLRELANDPAFGLTSQAEQDNVVAGKNGVGELRDYSFIIANDAAEKFFAGAKLLDQIRAQFVFDRDALVTALFKFTESSGRFKDCFWTAHRNP